MAHAATLENIWLDKWKYGDAERRFYEKKAKVSNVCIDTSPGKLEEIQTPLADEVAKARKILKNIRNGINDNQECAIYQPRAINIGEIQQQVHKFIAAFAAIETKLDFLTERVTALEESVADSINLPLHPVDLNTCSKYINGRRNNEENDDVDLFASDSDEEEDQAVVAIRARRLADYEARKSNKPIVVAKSNIILDVKPWSDETDMKGLEAAVRKVNTSGLLWGASKLVPLAYGIHKLQISCVIEDDLVSVDWLQEQIEALEEHVQSVDIAAFNKV